MDLNKMGTLMDDAGVSAVVATSVENVYYCTGNYNALLRELPERPSFAIFFRDGQPVYLLNAIEEDLARKESWITDIRTWGAGPSPIGCLVDILQQKKVLDGKVAIELQSLRASSYQELICLSPKTNFVDSANIFGKLREIKEKEEIEFLELAARAQRKAIEGAFACAEPGWTEKQISEMIGHRMLSLGFDEIVWRTVETGTGTLSVHELPTERRLKAGDMVRADCGGRLKGYYSDLARMAVVSKPSEKQKTIYKALVLAQRETIKSMNVGVKISDLYRICKKTFEQNYAGPFIFPHIGHGLGVILHDEPQMVLGNENRLQENMVINIEPVYVDPGEATYHVEDLILVTSSGPRVLTGKLPDEELYIMT